jgi:hypothetical protein
MNDRMNFLSVHIYYDLSMISYNKEVSYQYVRYDIHTDHARVRGTDISYNVCWLILIITVRKNSHILNRMILTLRYAD